jgi:hypothetical protein
MGLCMGLSCGHQWSLGTSTQRALTCQPGHRRSQLIALHSPVVKCGHCRLLRSLRILSNG